MTETSHYLDIGKFHCIAVSDGYISVPSRSSGADGKPEFEKMDVSCLYISDGEHNILVDTGCGDGFQDSSGKLAANLVKEGVKPSDIDLVIYTHGHEDHVGGTFDKAGKLLYPNARQLASGAEWEAWVRKPDSDFNRNLFASARKNLLTIPEKFDLFEGYSEPVPGIRLVPAPGHTLGGIMVRVEDGEDALLCIGDLIHSFNEFTSPGLYSFLDADPESAIQLRTDGLAELAESGTLVFACHFPFPGIGRFVEKAGALGWETASK